jgi:nucleoside-diphosphate-sugar epimerase
LPLGVLHNPRNLVAIGNLVDLLTICISHRAEANQTFQVSDGEDLSITELLTRLGRATRRPARLLSVPPRVIQFCAALVGARTAARGCVHRCRRTCRGHAGNWIGRHPVSVESALNQLLHSFGNDN